MERLRVFVYSILGGVCIGLGGIAFLSIDNIIIGSLFFCLGLFTIMTNGLFLYTGKVCYVLEQDAAYAFELLIVWTGNFLGTAAVGLLIGVTRISVLSVRAQSISSVKLSDSLLSIFILAILCNLMICIAVDGFKRNQHELGKYLSIVFGVAGFILCGFEHCIANMFYFTVGGAWSGRAVLYTVAATLGNGVGGVIFPLARRWGERIAKSSSGSVDL